MPSVVTSPVGAPVVACAGAAKPTSGNMKTDERKHRGTFMFTSSSRAGEKERGGRLGLNVSRRRSRLYTRCASARASATRTAARSTIEYCLPSGGVPVSAVVIVAGSGCTCRSAPPKETASTFAADASLGDRKQSALHRVPEGRSVLTSTPRWPPCSDPRRDRSTEAPKRPLSLFGTLPSRPSCRGRGRSRTRRG